MREHPIHDLLNISLNSVIRMVDTGKVIGQPIILGPDRMLIPISRVTFGFGAGGSEYQGRPEEKKKDNYYDVESGEELYPFGGGSGGGVSIKPTSFIFIDQGKIDVIHVERTENLAEQIFEFIVKMTQSNDRP